MCATKIKTKPFSFPQLCYLYHQMAIFFIFDQGKTEITGGKDRMVKKEEMSNNIKTKYTIQIKYAKEVQVNCYEITANSNNSSSLYLKEQATISNNPSPPK